MKELEGILQSLKQPMIDTLRAWIQIPSVKGTPEPGAPFGREVRRALDRALADCEALGFKTETFDGYAAHADLGEGEDKDALAILAHLDVVPQGDGWDYPPFGAEIADGRVYGRGTSDDKGPCVAALYAMQAVKMAGVPLKRKVRLILGCDEESGWEDIAYYKTRAVMPDMGFSPDACYPVINIEKGLCHLAVRGENAKTGLRVLEISAGERPNVIPGKASALVAGGDELIAAVAEIGKRHGFDMSAKREGAGVRVYSEGVTGHAAYPEAGKNAIGQLLITLRDLGAEGAVATLANAVGMEYDGESLGVRVEDGLSGKLTCNLGILRVDDSSVYATLDIRYPVLANAERMVDTLRARLPGLSVTVDTLKAPHHVQAESKLVQSLLSAYTEVTGLPGEAIAIGGGTYARALKEGVAFGSTFPGDPDIAHQANEHISIDSLMKNLEIFTRAIIKLAGK